MAKDAFKVKDHASNETHQAAVEHYKTRADERPKQFWDEDNRTWIKETS